GRPPLDVLDEIEDILGIACAPVTWPIGMGAHFKGVYHLLDDTVHLYTGDTQQARTVAVSGPDDPQLATIAGDELDTLREEIELIREAGNAFDLERYRAGELTPVFFGSAINNFGIKPLLDAFVEYAPAPVFLCSAINICAIKPLLDASLDYAPAPIAHPTQTRTVAPGEPDLSGFVFKIQANMDPHHRDRVAFMRVCSGHYQKGMKIRH